MYIPVKLKLTISIVLSILWMLFSLWIALPWIAELSVTMQGFVESVSVLADFSVIIGKTLAWMIVSGLALFPGLANAFLISSLFFDKRPKYDITVKPPDITVLIAAYNEEKNIYQTVEAIYKQNYGGKIHILIGDDGSTDNTRAEAYRAHCDFKPLGLKVQCVSMAQNAGKSGVLNHILKFVKTKYFVTIDADTYLYKDALVHLVSHIVQGPKHTGAVAGTVLARNSRDTWMTRIQEWDFFHGISLVKRIQSMYQGTLVAQGAFSAYRTGIIRTCKGWPETIGEDIVLTWAIRRRGYRVGHCERALAFTSVPETYKQFFKQRKRWSIGLIEAFKAHWQVMFQFKPSTPFIWMNLLFPFNDFMWVVAFIPGVIAAIFFQWYAIAGILTIFLLPLAMIMNWIIYIRHVKVFEELGLKVRKNVLGFLFYIFFYQFLMVPATLWGYFSEMIGLNKDWGTK